jgi:hypothetical protein
MLLFHEAPSFSTLFHAIVPKLHLQHYQGVYSVSIVSTMFLGHRQFQNNVFKAPTLLLECGSLSFRIHD